MSAALTAAEAELNAAGDKADQTYFAWKRDPSPETWAAWAHATVSESKARQAVDEIEGRNVIEGVR